MSLQDTLKQIRRQLAEWIEQQQRLRCRKLNVVRLEDRRLPDATFALIGDALTLNGVDGTTDSIDVSFDSSTSTLNLTLNSGNWLDGTGGPLDPALNVAGNLLSVDLNSLVSGGLSLLQIDGGVSLKNVTDSGDAFSVQSLVVSGESDVVLDSENDFDSIDVTANSLSLFDSDELQIARLDIATLANIAATGDLTSAPSAQLSVDGNLSVSGLSIHLAETNSFGSLTFQSDGNVTIVETDSMQLTGSSSAGSIDLQAASNLSDDSTAEILVVNHASFSAASISITGSFEAGSLSFHATDSVEIEEVDGILVSGTSEAAVSLRLIAGDSIQLDNTIDVDGDVTLESNGGGDILLNAKLMATGLVEFSSSGGIEINSDIDPLTVTLQSNDDIVVNAAIVASDQITIEAGLDGSGSFDLQAGGSLLVDNLTNTAGVTISTGATSGTVSVAGSITADALIEIATNESVNGSGLIQSHDLAIRAVTGIGSMSDLNTQVSNLSFRNASSGNVGISNIGALSITGAGSINGTAGNELGNFGLGTTTISAASPLTINANVSSVGSMTLTAGETADAPGFADDLQINTGVTVSVSGAAATLTLRAGDDVVVQGSASATSGNLIVEAGFSDLDGEGSIHFDGQLVAGQQADLNAITGINDDLTGNIKASSLRVLGGDYATLDNGHDVSNIAANFAGSLTFQNNTSFDVTTVGASSGITLTQLGATLDLTASAGTIGLASDVTTQGHQTYHSAVELKSNSTIDSGSGDVTFASTVNSETGQAFGLVVNSSGQTSFLDSVGTGANQELGFLTTDAAGSTVLSDDVATTGEQSFGDAVTLTGNITLSATDTDADEEGIDFGSTVAGGGNDLAILGGAGFAAAVSSVGVLSADHIDSESTISATSVSVTGTSDLGGNVATSGSQLYSGAVLLTANVELVSSGNQSVTLNSTVDGAHNLTIRTGGVTSLNGDIGGTTQLNELTTDAAGQTRIDAANVKADVIQFNDSVVLQQSVTFDATTSVEFGSSASGNSGSEDLTVTAPTVTFDGTISNLTDVTVDASGQTTFNGGVNIAGLLRTDAPGITKINAATITADTVQFDDAVELCQDTTITADRITFGKTIDEAAVATGSDLTLTITNPAVANGDISIGDNVGATRRLESITVTAANDVTFQGTVETDGAVIQQSGSGLTTFNGTGVSGIGGNLNITTNNVSFNTSDMTTVGAIVVVAANQVLLNAGAGLNSGGSTITLRANQDAAGAEGLVQQDGSVVATTNTSANAVLIDVSGSGSAAINTIQAAGIVTVTAGGSILDNSTAESANVTATALALTAQSGIGGAAAADLDTNVVNLEASTVTGGITISEANAVTIGGVNDSLTGMNVQSSGDISLTANGSITVAESVNGPDDISLTALGSLSDLTISSGSGVTSTDGDILLSADRTVTVSASVNTSQSGSISITGNSLAGTRNVIVNGGAMISVMNGDLTIDADQGSQQSGNFAGILIDAAELRTTGSGDVILTGRGGDSASGSQSGVDLRNGSLVRSTSNAANAGHISITGIGGANAADQNSGIAVSSGSQITTVTGDISLVGTGGNGAGTLNHGIMLDAATVTAVGTSAVAVADVHLTGTAGSGVGSNAIVMSNSTSITVQNSAFTNGATLTLESSVGNVVQNTSASVTAGNLQLLGTTTGNFDLSEANNAGTLAASIRGTLHFTDTNALIIGTAGSTSGLNSSNHDVRLTVQSGGLQIGDSIGAAGSDDINVGTADLTLNVSGAIGQSTGNSVTANGLELLGDGSTILEDTGNAVSTFAANYNGAIRFANSQPLTVGSLASTFAATSGISTSNDDVTLCATSIDLAEDVSIGTGTLRLQATTGSVIQSAGTILASDLGVRAFSGITLDSAGNDVNLFAADGGIGNVVIVDTNGFAIGTVTANGCFTPDVSGITSGQDFEACVASGSIHLSASLNITGTVRLEATTGSVTSTAAGTINAANLAVKAANAIDLNVATNQITGTFAAESTLLGSIEFADADGFTVGTVAPGACVASVNGVTTTDGNILLTTSNGTLTSQTQIIATNGNAEILVTGTGDVVLNGITQATASGHVLVSTIDGDVNVNGAVTSQAGHIRLAAAGAGQDVTVNADVTSTSGHVTVLAQDAVTLTAGNDIQTGGSGTIHVDAATGSIGMNASSTMSTVQGDIRLQAAGDVTLGDLTSTRGNVSLISATGSILDADPNDSDVDVTAVGLRIEAANSIGTLGAGSNAIDTSVTTLSARAGSGGVNIFESNGLVIDDVAVLTQQVSADGSLVAINDVTQSDIVTTSGGSIVLTAELGAITLNDGTAAADGTAVRASSNGNVRITTLAANGDVIANASVASSGGHVSILAADDIVTNGSVTTMASGTIHLSASNQTVDSANDGVLINASLETVDGDVLVNSSLDIRQNASVTSTSGDIGFVASRDVTQSASGDVNVTTGNVLIEAGRNWTMSSGTLISAGGSIDGRAINGEIALGELNAAHVAISAQEDISDANGATINIVADTLSMRSTNGSIGAAGNSAIDTQVNVLAAIAATGIAIQEADGLIVDHVNAVTVTVDIQRVNSTGSTDAVSTNRNTQALDDLTTTNNGSILLQTLAGSISLNDGTDADTLSVTAHGTGNVLIETLGAGGDVIVNSGVRSGSGHVMLNAANDVDVNGSVITSGAGTILIQAANDVHVDALLQTTDGDILISADRDLRQSAAINSGNGDVGLLASRDVTQTAAGDITTTAGDVLVEAGNNWTMADGTTIIAGGGEVDGKALAGSIALGQIESTHVALSALTNITDTNGAALNIDAATLSLRATNGAIGGPGSAAIETQITTLAASAATGIAIQEADGLTVDHVAAVGVTVGAVNDVNFDDTLSDVTEVRNTNALNDLTTTNNGDILLQSVTGSLTLNDGADADALAVTANGTGNVLIETLAAGADVIVNSGVHSGNGHVTVNSANDVDVNGSVITGGVGTILIQANNDVRIDALLQTSDGDILIRADRDLHQTAAINSTNGDIGLIASRDVTQTATGDITTTAGDVLVEAGRNWSMSNGTTIIAGGGELDGKALSGDLALGEIRSTNVALTAQGSITDANGATLNVDAATLSMRAITGSIGQSHTTNNTPNLNANAIDTQVTTLAATAGTAIYIEEADGLTIDTVAAVSVSVSDPQQVNFDNTTTNVPESRGTATLEDLTTTSNGPIKVVTLNGSLTLNGGSDGSSLSAHGTGDVLLQARGAGSDLIINGTISSGTGNITLTATNQVDLNAGINTAGNGTMFIEGSGVSVDSALTTANGNVLIRSTDGISQTAAITSTNGNIGLIATGSITQTATGDITTTTGDVLIEAGTDWTMSNGTVITAGGGDFDGKALAGNIAVGQINALRTAMTANGNISDANGATLNVIGTSLSLRATSGAIGGPGAAALETQIQTLSALAATGISIQELDGLTIDNVAAVSVTVAGIQQVHFNSSTSGVTETRSTATLDDLTTTNDGDILLRSTNGSIVLNDGLDGDTIAVAAHGTGDVLIQTAAADGDIIVNGGIRSGSGHVTLSAGDDLDVNQSIITAGNGSLLLKASNGVVGDLLNGTDGITIDALVQSAAGDILLQSSQDVRQTATITSSSGDIGIVASRDVNQTATGDVTTTSGNGLVEAGRDWTMSNGTTIFAGGGSFDGKALAGSIALGQIESTHVALSASNQITDANTASLNVIAETLSLRATSGAIGGPGAAVIDTQVNVLAATAATGISIDEVDGLSVDHVAAVSVSVNVRQVNPNGTTTVITESRNTQALDDLVTTNDGSILLQSTVGSIVLNDGLDADSVSVSAHGTGNVLIQTLAANGDITIQAGIRSGSGSVTLDAGDDIDVNDSIITGGSGSILLRATNGVTSNVTATVDGISIDGQLQTSSGDILIDSELDLRQTAGVTSASGDVGLIAARDITQTATGDITATAGDVLVEAGRNWTMSNGTTIIAGGGEVDGKAISGDLALGQIRSTNVALTAQGSITDANGASLNVDATTLSLRAITGSIGQSHTTNNSANLNVNAIDTQVQTLAATAATGIYIEEADAIVVDNVAAVSVTVADINESAFDGTTAVVSETRGTQTLNDLTTTNDGSIKLVSRAGSITVNSGLNGSPGIFANGTGDILLQAESAGSDVILNSDVIATTGHITIDAADSVVIEDDVTTGGSGTLFVVARGGSVTMNDADGNLLGIQTTGGNVLIDAATTLTLNAMIQSNTGTIALQSDVDILQNADITTGGDLVMKAGRDLRMNATSISSVGGGELLLTAERDIEVALVEATNVSIEAGRDIRDARLAAQTNVRSTTLRMIAGGEIGGANSAAAAGTNLHAIDTEVAVVTAKAANGISIQEVAAGGAIQVGSVADLTVSLTVQRANFNSTTSTESLSETLDGLADLTTTADGDIRLVTVNGTIRINDGSGSVENGANGIGVRAMGSGNVLVHAGGTTSDLTINADVQSGSGHVTLTADDDVLINADVRTAGKGTVFVAASNRNAADSNAIVMQNGTSIETAGGNVRMVADREGHLLLSTINASTGSVSLLAEGNILDNNGAAINVIANAARLVADASVTNASNGLGMIGGPETGAASSSNVNAIDTQVNILAAESAEGVFVRELDGLTVDATGDISVEEVNFNSTTTTRTDSSLSDITTTHDGTIRLQSITGSMVLNDGTDGDNRSVSANGTGNILVETLAGDGDVTVNSRVQSGTGHVTLSATDDVRISAAVSTSGAGTIVIQASNGANDAGPGQTDGIRVDATLTTLDGDILLTSTRDIRVNSAISSTDGNIGLLAGRDVVQTNTGDITSTNSDVLVEAQRHWTMATDSVVTAGGGEMIGTALTGTITLGRINADHVALSAGNAIADANGVLLNIVGNTASLRAGSMIGTSGDRIETQIDTLAALSGTGAYISEADDLTIDTVSSVTVILADPMRVDFNGSETPLPQARTTQTLEDVTTTNNNEIHVRTDAGMLTIEGGADNVGITANGSGDILLEAFGATSDIIANARIISTTGDISVVADRDIVQNNEGDILTSNADVLIDAGRNWSMASDAEVRSISGSVGGVTGTGEIALGQITANQVALQSAKSISDSNGVRANIVATTLSMSAVESIGDRNNAGTTPTALADAIDTNVQTIAASSHHGLFINEANSLIVGTVASQTIGGTTFGTQVGLNSDNSDILLNIGQNLTLNQTVNAGTADLRIIASGNVSQSASGIIRADEFGLQQNSTTSGDVILFSANDVNVIAIENLFDGGDLTFADADDLIIRTVSSQTVGIITFTGTTGLKATGGDVHVQAQGDVTILRSITSTNGVVDSTGASGESILIEAVDGNIVIDATAGAIVISTDEGPGSHATTGDSVTLLADSDRSYSGDLDGDSIADAIDPDMDGDGILNNVDATVTGTTEGKVTMLGDVTVASDGGVAKKFGPRPAVGESSTAFFIFTSDPLPVVIDNAPAFWNGLNASINAFEVEIGVVGEENLTVDIDWRDLANEVDVINDPASQLLGQNLGIDNPISSERFQQFLIANGGLVNAIGHLYTAADLTLFQKVLNITTIVIDLSVSHHESLNIGGAFIEQAGTAQSVPGLDVTSTDNPTNGFGNFDNGVATFKIPTVTPAPPALFAAESSIRVDRPLSVAPPENSSAFASLVVGDFSGGAVSGSAFSTEVYFQIRRQFEVDGPTEVVVERIADSRLISSREALEKFVEQHPELQDGAGYEIWLISETGGQKVERPVVEFEITGGKPGPASEAEQNSAEPPKLIDLPFEQPEEMPAEPANELPEGTTSLEMDAPNPIDALPVDQPAASSEEAVSSIHDSLEITDELDLLDSTDVASQSAMFGESASVLTGTIVGLAVNRFRSRQLADPDPPRFSRAARFRRGQGDG